MGDNVDEGICSRREALSIASEQNLDLVMISDASNPPVCKIVDYLKYIYQKKKRAKEIKANEKKVVLKEIRFTPVTSEHDYKFKFNHAVKFLKDKSKLRVVMGFNRSSMGCLDRGEAMLLRFANELAEYGTVDQLPKFDNTKQTRFMKMILLLSPHAKK